MSSPGGSTAQAYIIYASVSLTGRPLVEVLLRRPTFALSRTIRQTNDSHIPEPLTSLVSLASGISPPCD
ncbi:hypothetical protein N7516_011395 [Penicillium verrucosum]|uniref:Uncharacterized protein n=2 Tax=Penicillium TaxID=5073 RepID=A0A0N0RZR8_9EURO|nr:uncharacterized protein N7516_011395 [Penicillium verrucosum]KAJ5920537.1 hypothetical protein N7516_011395 [Penicillium verrucosum]KOS47122.1 hypothetical protein ACN38_g1975 [Penicillium nordicum]KUM61975.1 hypothetical protein ACN42_g5145 [Penicillium freii]